MVIDGSVSYEALGFKVILNWEWRKSDREAVAQVLNLVARHTFLTSPAEVEYAGRVAGSSMRLRQGLEALGGQQARQDSAPTVLMSTLANECGVLYNRIVALDGEFMKHVDQVKHMLHSGYEYLKPELELLTSYGANPLLQNERLNVMDIKPPVLQWSFIEALAYSRYRFGMYLGAAASSAKVRNVPEPLRNMLAFYS